MSTTRAVPPLLPAQAFLLEAIARDALGDESAAGRALERALECAEPDGALLPFLLHPEPGLLERHARHRTSHAALIAEILMAGAGSAMVDGGRLVNIPVDAVGGWAWCQRRWSCPS